MRRHISALMTSQPFAVARPVQDAIGALSLCVTFVGLLFLPGLF